MGSHRWRDRDQRDIEKAEEMRMIGTPARGLPPSKRYKVDPSYSREPKAFCGNVTKLGLPPCQFGEGTYCYSRKVCSSQIDLNDPEKYTEAAKRKARMEEQAALDHARKISSRMRDDRYMSDQEYGDLIKRIIGD